MHSVRTGRGVTITFSLRSDMTAAGQSWSNLHSLPRPRMIGIRHAFDLIAAWPPFKRALRGAVQFVSTHAVPVTLAVVRRVVARCRVRSDSPLEGARFELPVPLEPRDLAMAETARGFRRPARISRQVNRRRRRSILRAWSSRHGSGNRHLRRTSRQCDLLR
jgi:hypothetical protein